MVTVASKQNEMVQTSQVFNTECYKSLLGGLLGATDSRAEARGRQFGVASVCRILMTTFSLCLGKIHARQSPAGRIFDSYPLL